MPKAKAATAKCTIKTDKRKTNCFKVSFEELTAGELMALNNALDGYAERSPVAQSVLSYLGNAIAQNADSAKIFDVFKD